MNCPVPTTAGLEGAADNKVVSPLIHFFINGNGEFLLLLSDYGSALDTIRYCTYCSLLPETALTSSRIDYPFDIVKQPLAMTAPRLHLLCINPFQQIARVPDFVVTPLLRVLRCLA